MIPEASTSYDTLGQWSPRVKRSGRLATVGKELLQQLMALDPDEYNRMSTAEQQWVTETLDRELLLRTPADFATRLSGGVWEPYPHLVVTSDAIVTMVEDDDCDILLVEEPVRHGKTLLCSRWAPAWFVCKYRQRALLASYEADFAATHGRFARELVAEHGAQFGAHIDNSSRSSSRWELVGGDGGMGTAGVGGPITGKGGHLLIVDDPVKNAEEAQSAVMREKQWEWWQSTFLTRREPGAKILVIMSRWHEDDLTGRILKHTDGLRVKRIRLPAIAEEDGDVLGRKPGQALCPQRYDKKALGAIREAVGSSVWASLYQQRPIPLGGGLFRRAFFQHRYETIVKEDGTKFYMLGDKVVEAESMWKFSTMDVAFTRNKRSDYTALATFGVAPTDPPSLVMLQMRRVRTEEAQHSPLITEVWNTQNPSWVGIEKGNATLSLFSEAQRSGVVVRWLQPDKNKFARAETAAALMEAGRVWLPMEAEWLSDFIDEVLTFPAGKYDDQVDVLAYAAIELANRTVHARHFKQEPQTPADVMWERLRKRGQTSKHHPTLGRLP